MDVWFFLLILGVLGLILMEVVQSVVYLAIGSEKVCGWDYQIFDGGEFIFCYQFVYYDDWCVNMVKLQFKMIYFGLVGYLIEVGIVLLMCNGLILFFSYCFNLELIIYGECVNDLILILGKGWENYFWGGVVLKVWVYNVFLQGQFCYSDYCLSYDEVNYLFVEVWVGYIFSFVGNFKFSYVFCVQIFEICSGEGDCVMVWGGLVVS